MKKRFPYEEIDGNLNDLSLPDEDVAWQKMQELLNRDEKDKRRVVPLLFRTLAGWIILVLTGVIVTWLFIRPEKTVSKVIKAGETAPAQKTPQQENRKEYPANDAEARDNLHADRKTVIISNQDKPDANIKPPAINETNKKMSLRLAAKKTQVDQPP